MRTLVWFRGKDLRVSDHEPLLDAVKDADRSKRDEVIPLFVIDPYFFAPSRAAELPHRMQFLVESLLELAASIEALGSRLVFVRGKSVDVVPALARKWKVDRVVGYRWTEPVGRKRDELVTKALGNIPFELYEGETLAAPGEVMTKSGSPFSVFGAFSRAFAKTMKIAPPRRAPKSLPPHSLRSERAPSLAEIGIERNPQLVPGGEKAAAARLRTFLRGPAPQYDVKRDLLGEAGTSRLSQDLKFGTLTPRHVWHAVHDHLDAHPRAERAYLNELVWRELAYHVLFHRPEVLRQPFRDTWAKFPWRRDARGWKAWLDGTTGYPIVDASARQLLATGFVHNRARMISASFLTKHLLIDYRLGEAHYLKYLTDGDWAANNLGWQWSAGCGVDAQPWFRVFNPILQGTRFDPDGTYVKTWLPELRDVPRRDIHKPYRKPIVEHEYARSRFLAVAKGHLG